MLLPSPVAPPVTRILLPDNKFFSNTLVVLLLKGVTNIVHGGKPARQRNRLSCCCRSLFHRGVLATCLSNGDQRQIELRGPLFPRCRFSLQEDSFKRGAVGFLEPNFCQQALG